MRKYKILFSFLVIMLANQLIAQNNKVSFSGLGRALLENDKLGSKDTVNNDRVNSGYMLTDLGFDIKPNSTTEIQAMMRLKNEYGGFYGQGASLAFRQLYIKGLIAKVIKYQFGDINIGLTPYTLFNSNGDGSINEATAIKMLRNINEYDNFNYGNTWRQQGAQAEFHLKFPVLIQTIKVNTFITRNRAAINTYPELLYGGGNVTISQSKNLVIGCNYVNMFSLGKTTDTDERTYNPVLTGDFNLQTSGVDKKFYIKGESGISAFYNKNNSTSPVNKSDFFYDVAIGTQLKSSRVGVQISYKDVGPDFFSAGAQSKRIDFSGQPGLFTKVANTSLARQISLYDITRDQQVYNKIIGTQLMNYDVRLSNVLPYGVATPNRKGVNMNINYRDSMNVIYVDADVYALSEIVGEGTTALRKFSLARLKADLNINKLLRWEKMIKITTGYQYETTSREGDTISGVKLTSHLLDGGLEFEVFRNFDVLAGAKFLMSDGNEFISERDQYNAVTNFTPVSINSIESLYGGGIRYRFSTNIFLTVQGQLFERKNLNVTNTDYDFSQIFILYNMKF